MKRDSLGQKLTVFLPSDHFRRNVSRNHFQDCLRKYIFLNNYLLSIYLKSKLQ